ncbi:hypothetical protein DFR67_13129 [Williamsia limnetica]|uniref:Uncharacterized protein n=1 Tax=Williamsia limnetica TaxID=882452 RepID=A0A318RD59_WILLI|nr:hypothetical protein DFR67_13129 [Williamsia limnetica]
MSVKQNQTFWRLWRSSLLWAIPASYLTCGLGFSIALTIGLIGDGYSDSLADYLSAVLIGFFFWGTVIFIGTCYIVIPLFSVLIAVLRYSWHHWRQRGAVDASGHGLPSG